MVDDVHMLISIPPRYAVSQVMGFIKSKSAVAISRTYFGTGRWRCKFQTKASKPFQGGFLGIHLLAESSGLRIKENYIK